MSKKMYARILLTILVINSPTANGFYFDIEAEVITSNRIDVIFSNLKVYDSYRFNWTNNPRGMEFQFDPTNDATQSLPVMLNQPEGKGTIIFELWDLQSAELLENYSMFYNIKAKQEFSIPFVADILYFLTNLTFEEIILSVIFITFAIFLQYYIRKGR